MKKPTLLILAAGMGSRYGGLKQLDAFGPSGETILEYSIYDAIKAGFGKVVFVIRESFSDAFKAKFDPKLRGKIEVEYVYQELDNLPEGYSVPEGREKPWGTGHAVLMAKDSIDGPVAIINADDFYGADAYRALVDYMKEAKSDSEYCMIGYQIKNTLTDNGTVSRGVCKVDENDNLVEIVERVKIAREGSDIFYYEEDGKTEVHPETPVSMNCWAFSVGFFNHLENGFKQFLDRAGEEMKSEYFFPFEIADQLNANAISVKVIGSTANWFGVTYPEDKDSVLEELNKLIDNREYPTDLWA